MPKVHWVIPCPVCGKRLRLLNQAMLGRRGQCPSCRHKFVLEVPKSSEYFTKHGKYSADPATSPPEETQQYDHDFEVPADNDDAPEA